MGEHAPLRPGAGREPLCREPWQNYYILRRGILPCCHGYAAIAPMSEWKTAWNSPALQEIRSFLARGELSPYCLLSVSCPIVQRVATREQQEAAQREIDARQARAAARPLPLRIVNRMLFGLPAILYRRLAGEAAAPPGPRSRRATFIAAGRSSSRRGK